MIAERNFDSSSFWSEFERILHQMEQNLLIDLPVGADLRWNFVNNLKVESELVFAGLDDIGFHKLAYKIRHL